MNWFSRLPQKLQQSAYLHGPEAAWSKDDAIKVIQALSRLGTSVIGIDVWLMSEGAPRIPTPYIYQWDSGQPTTSDWTKSDSNAAAIAYIRDFQWDSRDASVQTQLPCFNLTVL